MITVDVLALSIELHQPGVFGHVPVEGTLRFVRARAAIRMAERSVATVDIKSTLSGYFDRIRCKPPVDQIEMVGRFVHKKTAAAGFQPVPAAEIVGSVTRVEEPTKIDRCHLADL